MPVILLNNYPANNLEKTITKKDGSPLHGEIWLYRQFLKFNEYDLLPDETWYLKHDFNLSKNTGSRNKVEGQIDFILISKYGILVFEVKGGGLKVIDDNYYSTNKANPKGYKSQNPFNQAKEYSHAIINLLDKKIFTYKAVILPHEANFKIIGHQLKGYEYLLFSKANFKFLNEEFNEKEINKRFFDFLIELAKSSRKKVVAGFNPSWDKERVNGKIFLEFPELSTKQIKQLKNEFFPNQTSYYNPEKINSEIILKENYEILKGLRRNDRVLVQGAPGTGKTVLAKKFIADNYLKQHNGIVFNANKLIKSKLEHVLLRDYELDPNKVSFQIFSNQTSIDNISTDVDFLVFDEAHEYFNKGLFDFIEKAKEKLENPKILVLYDPNQSIISQIEDLSFYTDYFIDAGFAHFYFDEQHRCAQHNNIAQLAKDILGNQDKNTIPNISVNTEIEKIKCLNGIIKDTKFTNSEKIILINDQIETNVNEIITDYFKSEIEELTDQNINIPSSKIRYTTPLKYRGLENKAAYVITNDFSEYNKVRNYVAVTRAMEQVKIILWN